MHKVKLFNYIKTKLLSDFTKNVATLVTGSTLAQLIPFFIAPILSRVYTPQEFGIMAVYLTIIQVLGSVAAARYEFAIVIPKEKDEAINLFVLGLFITTTVSLVSLVFVFLFKNSLLTWIKTDEYIWWVYLIPISTFLLGLNNLLNYYNVRLKSYKSIATSTVAKSASRSSVQLGGGLMNVGVSGLILGEVAAMLFGNVALAKKVKRDFTIEDINRDRIKYVASKYKRFPLFSMWSVFFSKLSLNISNVFIMSLFTVSQTGFYSHATRYITMPLSMIGTAVSQVLFKQVSDARIKSGNAKKEFLAVLKKLTLIAIPSFILLNFIVEDAFAWYFGEEWRIAGSYAKILLPFILIRFIVSPLSIINTAFEKQLMSLYIQLGLFIINLMIYFIVKLNQLDIISYLKIINITLSISYLIILFFIYLAASNKLKSKLF